MPEALENQHRCGYTPPPPPPAPLPPPQWHLSVKLTGVGVFSQKKRIGHCEQLLVVLQFKTDDRLIVSINMLLWLLSEH